MNPNDSLPLGPEQIPEPLYKEIYNSVPIFCADVIAVDDRGRFLMVKRKNKPLQNTWGFPGGRVLKNEKIEDAALRKLKEETGLTGTFVRQIGFYELIGKEGYYENTSVHTPVVVSLVLADNHNEPRVDDQSSDYKWCSAIDPEWHPFLKEMLERAGFKE